MEGGPTHSTLALRIRLVCGGHSSRSSGVDYAAFIRQTHGAESMTALTQPENDDVIATLNHILELELAGLVRYMHYSFMIFGHNRIPIVGWLRDQAEESKTHATQAGEHITNLGGHPSLKLGSLLETHKHNVDEILAEALAHEEEGLAEYRKLLKQVADKSIMLEEYARTQISAEEEHLAEIRKMMRKPGSIK